MTVSNKSALAVTAPLLLIAVGIGAVLTATSASARSACDYMSGADRRDCIHEEAAERSAYNRALKEEEARARGADDAQNRPAQNYRNPYRATPSYGNTGQNAASAERERAQAEQQQAVAERRKAEADAIAAMPAASKDATQKLERIVEKDSKGWAFNHFDSGTVHNVKVADGSEKSGTVTLRGEYTYNGGSAGWVLAKLEHGKFNCVQFWDARIGCRDLRTAEQGKAMRGAVANALVSSMSDSSNGQRGSGTDDNARFNMWRQNNQMQGLNDNGTQK